MAILVMNGNTSIKATHIRQCIVNVRVVRVLQGTGLAVINAYGLVVPSGLGLEMVRSMQWTKPFKPGRKAALLKPK
jgi:hypothetical protein